jgi:hypothetical protein
VEGDLYPLISLGGVESGGLKSLSCENGEAGF